MIHGYIPYGNFNVGFTLVSPLTLSITAPTNTSFKSSTITIEINWTVGANGSIDKITYNVDNGTNATYTEATTITGLGNGHHVLYVFANTTDGGIVNAQGNFTVNTSLPWSINFSAFNGSTTNFSNLTRAQQENITNATIENTTFGKIEFRSTINITQDLDLNQHIVFGNKSLTLNSTAVQDFNKSANVSVYQVHFTDPQVLIDGAACSAATCTELSYNTTSKVFTFNVTHFTNYSLRETPQSQQDTPAPTPAGGGGGGGGGGPTYIYENEQIAILEIIVPPLVSFEEEGTRKTAIVFSNSGNVTIEDLAANAFTESTEVDISFEAPAITALLPGEKISVPLFITAKPGIQTRKHEIVIEATARRPKLVHGARLIIELKPKDEVKDAQENVAFAENLLEKNPSCAELNELLERARIELEKKNYAEARKLAEGSITGCQNLLSQGLKTLESPRRLIKKRSLWFVISVIVSALLLTSAFFKFMTRTKEKKEHDTNHAKKVKWLFVTAAMLLVVIVGGIIAILKSQSADWIASSGSFAARSKDKLGVLQNLSSARSVIWYVGLSIFVALLIILRKKLLKGGKEKPQKGGIDTELARINAELRSMK